MLQKLDKFAPYIALLILGYLTYTTTEDPRSKLAEGKELPQITKRMLNPELLKPADHASPAGRDPFEVDWASYINRGRPCAATSRPTSKPATQPASAPASRPAKPKIPPMKGKLMAVLVGEDLRLAIIDGKVYEAGSLIGGTDPAKCWRVQSIEKNEVVVNFGRLRRVLTVAEQQDQSDSPEDGKKKKGGEQ